MEGPTPLSYAHGACDVPLLGQTIGDNLRTTGPWGPLEALSLLVMFAGAFSLANSPLVSGMKGGGDEYHELLSQRSRSAQLRGTAPCQPPPSPS